MTKTVFTRFSSRLAPTPPRPQTRERNCSARRLLRRRSCRRWRNGGPKLRDDWHIEARGEWPRNDDSLGNANGIVNRAECVNVNLGVKNNGCAKETAISATLTTTTPGVTIVQGNSSYSDMVIDGSSMNTTPFKISVASSFVCGTEIALTQPTYASGTNRSCSLCRPVPGVRIRLSRPANSRRVTHSDGSDWPGRPPEHLRRQEQPGGGFPGMHPTKPLPHQHERRASLLHGDDQRAMGGPGDIESVAYDQTYDPANIDANYLGDSALAASGDRRQSELLVPSSGGA